MIALRLKSFFDEIISPVQSAFIPGRLITDNILVAYESIHTIKIRKLGRMVIAQSSSTCIRHMIGWSGDSWKIC
jgi:hypothetical protein